MAKEDGTVTETFDTLKAARNMEASGMHRQHAEAITDVLYKYKLTLDQERSLATKEDVMRLRGEELHAKVTGIHTAVEVLQTHVSRLRSDIAELKAEVAGLKARSRD